MVSRHLPHLTLLLAMVVAGCTPPGVTPKVKASSGPAATGASGQALVGLGGGKLTALDRSSLVTASQAGLIGNDGGSLITNDGGSLITNDGGSLITNDGGSLITNDGGSLIGNDGAGIGGTVTGPASLITNDGASLIGNDGAGIVAQGGGNAISDMGGLYHLNQAAPRPVKGAYVYLRTADGKFVTDAKGNLMATRTNAQGRYAFAGLVSKRNLEVYVPLGARKGAAVSLQAFVTHDAGRATTNLDAVSSLLTTYVLDKIVAAKPDPLASLDRLTRKLDDETRAIATGALGGQALALEQLTHAGATQNVQAARSASAALDKQLVTVDRALTIGSASLSSGQPATEVSLLTPRGLAPAPGGGFYVGEAPAGRIRLVDKAGLLTTYADISFGQAFRENFLQLSHMATGPKGELYVVSHTDGRVRRLDPGGATSTTLAGNGAIGPVIPGPAVNSPLNANALAVTPAGKVYIGEGTVKAVNVDGVITARSRVYALEDGKLVEQPIGLDWRLGLVMALAFNPSDGNLYVFASTDKDAPSTGHIERLLPNGKTELVKAGIPASFNCDMVCAPDGTLYVTSDNQGHQLHAVKPDGSSRVVAGTGAPVGASSLASTGSLGMLADGTVLVVDTTNGTVQALKADGRLTTVAGAQHSFQGGDFAGVSINGPTGVLFDEQDRLVVTEFGTNQVVRFDLDTKTLDTIAGSTNGNGPDHVSPTQTQFSNPSGIVLRDGRYYVIDASNRRLRTFTLGGTVETLAGKDGGADVLEPHKTYAPDEVSLQEGQGLVLDAQGNPYWSRNLGHQIARLIDGHVELVAGKPASRDFDLGALLAAGASPKAPEEVAFGFPSGMAFDKAGNLLVADTVAGRIYKISGIGTASASMESIAGIGLAAMTQAGGDDGPKKLPNDEGKPAKDMSLFFPLGLALDDVGNIYVAEAGTTNLPLLASNFGGVQKLDANLFPLVPGRVRRISAKDGTVSTVAGPGSRYFDHPTRPEEALVAPSGLALSRKHGLAITDTGANLVHVLPPSALTGP
ncbi:MAG: repeat containing protein [Cyanobacteria bacterium RYN_339]|nr:repeat containing protein [Cyanobacteria bacterium RYN_339]